MQRRVATRRYSAEGRLCVCRGRRSEELLRTIPHDRLLQLIAEKLSDSRVLALIESFLKQGVMDGLREWASEEGSPQGAVISPLLSHIYLDPLDHRMAAAGFEMVRYADDFVIMCRTAEDAGAALTLVRDWTAEAGLTLHAEKTHVAHAEADGFEFLGYHFTRGERFPRTKSLKKLKATIREKTRRKQRHGIDCTIQDVNTTLVGWFEYFKHATKGYVFEELDRFIRQRLRAILKKQQKRPGTPKGRDLQRWPNSFFGNLKLFSLKTAHELACQSSTR